ncbi:uncharacterized protein LOC109852021 isoform X1 [Pseudomyrmex gracilis]|uniref:uncharacterized protein LOC109852021 isoform X1 n=1 Tax=Pseudomyrmex gracilis TaxID=219809 RepID=UPI000995DC37|nr:uncharacterized protein LOC109852021 isoform X1 [Pseudomyrmex gracilis]
MSKMAMSYIILAVCITYQTAQAGTLDWNSLLSLPQNLDKLHNVFELAQNSISSYSSQSEQAIDQTIANISNERDLVQQDRDSLLKNAQNAEPCDKLKYELKASTDSLYVSLYNCVLKGLASVKLTNSNFTQLSNDLLSTLNKELPELTKCASKSNLSGQLSCLANTTADDTFKLALSLLKTLPKISVDYLTVLPKTALCIGQSFPQIFSNTSIIEDAKLCGRSLTQPLTTISKTA